MHKKTILKMCRVTRMRYQDDLVWDTHPVCKMPDWLPAWRNGAPPHELYEWLLEQSAINPDIHQAMKDAGMRPRPLINVSRE